MKGQVKWFDDEKGYGFITRDDGGKDIFVHRTGIAGSGRGTRKRLTDGELVEFEIVEKERGPQAVNVTSS